jgi:uncharacterized membrane protein
MPSKTAKWFYVGLNVAVYANYCMFIIIMLRLKSLQIYMDGKMLEKSKLDSALKRIKYIRAIFVFMIVISYLMHIFTIFYDLFGWLHRKDFAWLNFAQATFCLVVEFAVYSYLLNMAYEL